MWCKGFRVMLAVLFLVGMIMPYSFADEGSDEIAALKAQVQQLMQRIEKLETEQAQSKAAVVKATEEVAKVKEAQSPRVDLANALTKLKMKGRFAAGYFNSGKAGSFSSGSFEMPDAKLQFSLQPDDINTIILRFNLNNGATSISSTNPLLDYFYLQSKDFLPFLKNTPYSVSGRLGRFKLGFGEETWSDNPIEGIVPSNSAAKAGASDEALEFAGKIDLAKLGLTGLRPLGWVTSVSNGSQGVGSDTSSGKAFMGKVYYTFIDPLYFSASYYDSGNLKGASEMSIAGLASIPAGGTDWQRKAWEVDARYDFKKGKKPQDPPAYSDSKAILRLSYGEFNDHANRGRHGKFGFVDGIYNLNKKLYTAGRLSFVNLDGNATASLNSITANKHDRYSLGFGYRWSENTILKLSYDWNKESGDNIEDADNDLISTVVAAQF